MRMMVEALMTSPSATRGELYRVEGQLLQERTMPAPHRDIQEWFLRLPSGEPVVVYLPARDAMALNADGQVVTIDARFYKVLEAIARDQQVRKYPAFFGRSPRLLAQTRSAVTERMDILILLGFIAILVCVGLALIAYARRQMNSTTRQPHRPVQPRPRATEDPANALRELRSQAERKST